MTDFKIPLGAWIQSGVAQLTLHFESQFRVFSEGLSTLLEKSIGFLAWFHPLTLIFGLSFLIFLLSRNLRNTLLTLGGLLLIVNLGYWHETLETVSLVVFSTLISAGLGIPLGIVSAHHPKVYRVLQPVLDLMQTIPTFVYLIPTLMLFGLGMAPGVISTVIFAMPAPIRLTYLGVSSVPASLLEVGEAFGATRWQKLFQIEIPHALPTIRAGISQCVMLSLSMVVIAALVGADGLGKPVVQALNTVNISKGFEAGIAIVIVAIILDRLLMIRPRKSSSNEVADAHS
jgi:glycine betaine/proline transport system permease protein